MDYRKRCFAVQFVIEDDSAISGFDSGESFIEDMKETFFEDFQNYKILSSDHCEVWEGEAVKKLEVVRSDVQFTMQEEKYIKMENECEEVDKEMGGTN